MAGGDLHKSPELIPRARTPGGRGGTPPLLYEIVFWNARALALMRTTEMITRAATFGQRSLNDAPRMMMPRAILMKCVAGSSRATTCSTGGSEESGKM